MSDFTKAIKGIEGLTNRALKEMNFTSVEDFKTWSKEKQKVWSCLDGISRWCDNLNVLQGQKVNDHEVTEGDKGEAGD